MKKIINIGFVLSGIACVIFSVLGPFYSVVHPGTLLMFLTGVLFILCVIFDKKENKGNFVKFVYWMAFAWMIFVAVFISVNFLGGLTKLPNNGDNATVIVLGARIKDGEVTLVQKRRLDVAIDYLEENPNAKCIVTGGLQKDEGLVVADIMKKYLRTAGIEEDRIFIEGKAQDTYENLLYSKDIIEKNNLSKTVILVSDNFHLLRSTWFAKSIGYTSVYRLACHTPLGILPSYWFREILSMLKGFLITAFPGLFGH